MSSGGWRCSATSCSCSCEVDCCAKACCGRPQNADRQNTQVRNRGTHRTFDMPAPCLVISIARNPLRDLCLCSQTALTCHNHWQSLSRRSLKCSTHFLEQSG